MNILATLALYNTILGFNDPKDSMAQKNENNFQMFYLK